MMVPVRASTRKALLEKAYNFFGERKQPKLSQTVFGLSPPNIFVGRAGYPKVNVGPLVSVGEELLQNSAEFIDSPAKWYGMEYAQIISMRSSLVRGKKKHSVSGSSRMLLDLQQTVVSEKSVDIEMSFSKPLDFSMDFSSFYQPMGPAGVLEKVQLAGNPVIPKKVDELCEEGVKVRQAVPEMLSAGFDVYYLQKILSAGVLGENKKLVPTRWSITAGDKMVADHYLQKVREMQVLNEVLLFSAEFLHNHFEVLLLPGKWEFEQFEAWAPGTVWTKGEQKHTVVGEYEPFEGRSDYAELEGGGYYAGRYGVAQALHSMRRQARCVVFREIGDGYQVPVGVWQVRENVRKAMKEKPVKLASLKEAVELLSMRLKIPLSEYFAKSRVLGQKKMFDF